MTHDTTTSRAPGMKMSPEKHTPNGEEKGNPTPMQPPLGYKKTLSLHEQIAIQVRRMKLELLRDEDVTETEEEADDFEVGDDYEPLSKWENDHMPSVKTLKARAAEINKQIAEANRKAAIEAHEKALKLKTPATPPAQPPGAVNSDN